MSGWNWFAWGLLGGTLAHLAPLWLALRRPRTIGDVPPAAGPRLPRVSVIVPARDEAAAVEATLTSLLGLEYPELEVIAVDDRSEDGTGEIMDRVAARDPRCQVVHVTDLPPGWLGKNHANMCGAARATGDLFLFTDGDVLFAPPVLRHAVGAMTSHGLDHLVLFPDVPRGGFWESVAVCYFGFVFSLVTWFPLARFSWARGSYVGVGAFNLVKRGAYEAIGTHRRLALEVADDLMLGKLVKQSGHAQMALLGTPLVSVKWQTGLSGVIRGLEKNAFAGVRFSVALALAAVTVHTLAMALPPILAATGPARLPFGLVALATLATYALSVRAIGYPLALALTYPVASLLLSYMVLRSMYVTLRDGGVTWRGTFYPLDELRRGKV
jgi:hypothetical protein